MEHIDRPPTVTIVHSSGWRVDLYVGTHDLKALCDREYPITQATTFRLLWAKIIGALEQQGQTPMPDSDHTKINLKELRIHEFVEEPSAKK